MQEKELIIHGSKLTLLDPHQDNRGALIEIFRSDWEGLTYPQWNLLYSKKNTLRGMRLHLRCTDYVVVIQGLLQLGLYDLRPNSPSYQKSVLIELHANNFNSLKIPAGVVHGFYFAEDTIHVIGLSDLRDITDSDDLMGCRWDDPSLNITWPCTDPILAERDQMTGSLNELYLQMLSNIP